MVIGNFIRVSGLTVAAVLLLSTAALAQDVADGGGPQITHDLNPGGDGNGIAVGEPDPNDGGPDIVIDDGDFVPGDDGPDDDWGDDDGSDDDSSGDDGAGEDGSGTDIVIDDGDHIGTPGDLCPDCDVFIANLTPETGPLSMAAPLAAQVAAAPAAKPRRSSARPAVSGNRIEVCLAQHPNLPWLCEWQTGAGQ